MNSRILLVGALGLGIILSPITAPSQVPQSLPMQALITDSVTDSPIGNSTTLTLYVEIQDSTGCVLYSEQFNPPVSNTDSKGIVSVALGQGTNQSYAVGLAGNFENIFSTAGTAVTCISGPPSSTLSAGNTRQVLFTTTGIFAGVTPVTLQSVPYAMNSDYLGGLSATGFIQTIGSVTQANMSSLVGGTDISALNLHNHDTHNDLRYARLGSSNSFTGGISATGVISTTGSLGVGTSAPGASLDIEESTPSLRIGGTGSSGNTLSLDFYGNNGTQNTASIKSSDNSNTLSFSTGGTTALTLDTSQNAIFSKSVSVTGTLGLGQYATGNAAGQEGNWPAPGAGTLLSALKAIGQSLEGTTWENSTTHVIKYWDGNQPQTVASTGTVVTSMTASSPLASSGGNTPNISIQQANSVQGGYLSSTDYVTFAGKQNALGYIPLNQAGDTMTGALTFDTWTNGTRPATFTAGTTGFNTTSAQLETWNGIAWVTGSSGSVTTVNGNNPVVSSGGTTPIISILQASSIQSGYLSSADYATFSNKVNRSGDSMTGALDMTNNLINNVANPVATTDAVNKAYVTAQNGNYLPLTGGTMTGPLTFDTWTNGTRPATFTAGTTGFNTTSAQLETWNGATWVSGASGSVSAVTASGPLASSGGSSPNITLLQATSTQGGYLSSTDWVTFNGKISSQWTTNGSNISYNTVGNVGIGTINPTYPLDVEANSSVIPMVKIENTNVGGYSEIDFYNSGSIFQGFLGWGNSSSGFANTMYIGTQNARPLTFLINGLERMRVDSSGNVGIGSTSPTAQLQVSTSVATTPGLIIQGIAGQSADLTDWMNNAGTKLSFVDNIGAFHGDGSHLVGIVGALSGLTAGGVTYATNSTAAGTDANNFFWDSTHHWLGIGTNMPSATLDVEGNFNLPTTTAAAGIINVGGTSFIHSYGTNNFFAGMTAGNTTLTTASATQEVGVGFSTLLHLTTGGSNTAVGYSALLNDSTGGQNTAVGWGALSYTTTQGQNTAVGYSALGGGSNSGNSNSALGFQALISNTSGSDNVAVGFQTLPDNSSGANNTALGFQALDGDTSGSANVGVGYGAGFYNQTGTSNVFIGYQAGPAVGMTALTNAIAIGSVATVTQSNSMVLGGTGGNAVNVGIGTTAPATALDVTGALTQRGMIPPAVSNAGQGVIYFDSGSNQFKVSQSGSAYSPLATLATVAGYLPLAGGTLTGPLNGTAFNTTGNITDGGILTVNGAGSSSFAGSVGIGSTSPGSTLDIRGPDTNFANYALRVGNSAGTYSLLVNDGGSIGLGTLPTGNNVTIGGNLYVEATNAVSLAMGNSGGTVYYGLIGNLSTDTWALGSGDSGGSFGGGNIAMVWKPTGGVGIGTTTPAYSLDVQSNNLTTANIVTGTTGGNSTALKVINNAPPGTNSTAISAQSVSDTTSGTAINANGASIGVIASGGTWGVYGNSTSGIGINGFSGTGTGVNGTSTTGYAIQGQSTSGISGFFQAGSPTSASATLVTQATASQTGPIFEAAGNSAITTIDSSGYLRIAAATANQALLTIGPSTATQPAIIMTSGALSTSTVSGGLEFDGNDLYIMDSASRRHAMAGIYIGSTGGFSGSMGNYASASSHCNILSPNSHMCSADEMVRSATFGIVMPAAGAWYNSGIPLAGGADCNGWTSSSVSNYGTSWMSSSGGGNYETCSTSYPIACCK